MSKLKIITSEHELDQLIKYCKETRYASVDYETPGFSFYDPLANPLTLSTSFQAGSSWVLPLAHKESPFVKKGVWKRFLTKYGKEVIENPDIIKVAWNLKYEYKWFLRDGIHMKGRLYDAMLAKYCLDEERPHGLKQFVKAMFPKYAGYEEFLADDDDEIVWKDVPLDKLCLYNGIDSDLTHRGMIYLEGRLIKMDFFNLFRNLLMMATRVLAESEYRGILIDRTYLQGLMQTYAVKIAGVENKLKSNRAVLKFERGYKKEFLSNLIEKMKLEIKEINRGNSKQKDRMIKDRNNKIQGYLQGKSFSKKDSWEGINFGSPQQLGNFLYDSEYGLRLKCPKQTKTGNNSTDEDTLIKLKPKDKTGFMDNLLDLRGLTKLNSTYIVGAHNLLDTNDRLHASFHMLTTTGRLGCRAPNLQNIPRDTTSSDIKRMFIPPFGYVLVEVDYSQAELRVVAEIAQDKAMIEIFKRNHNIHVATACKMFNIGYEEMKNILKDDKHPEWLMREKQKKIAKSLNFSILYMQGAAATAETLGVSVEEAKQFQKEWFRQFPQVAKWMKKQISFAHMHGYVISIFGRKRRLYDLYSEHKFKRAEAERQSVNTPIQGAASDFTQLSTVVMRDKVRQLELPIDMLQAYTVHDSIGFYMRPKDVHKTIPKLVEICDNPNTLEYFGFKLNEVKMKASPEVGLHWAGLKEYDPWTNYEDLLLKGIS